MNLAVHAGIEVGEDVCFWLESMALNFRRKRS